MTRTRSLAALKACGFIATMAAAGTLTAAVGEHMGLPSRQASRASRRQATAAKPTTRHQERQLVVAFIGMSGCPGSRDTGLVTAVPIARTMLRQLARRHAEEVKFVGVAVDPRVEDGLSFLKPFGPFSEIVVGGGWLGNEAALQYFARDMADSTAAVPSLVVVERTVELTSKHVSAGRDRLVLKVVGAEAIKRFAASTIVDRL